MAIGCKACEEKGLKSLAYSSDYDAYFCRICDTWLERQCSDEDCDFCVGRPETPSMDSDLEDDFAFNEEDK